MADYTFTPYYLHRVANYLSNINYSVTTGDTVTASIANRNPRAFCNSTLQILNVIFVCFFNSSRPNKPNSGDRLPPPVSFKLNVKKTTA